MSDIIDVNYTAEQMAKRYLMEKERVERLTAEVARLTADVARLQQERDEAIGLLGALVETSASTPARNFLEAKTWKDAQGFLRRLEGEARTL